MTSRAVTSDATTQGFWTIASWIALGAASAFLIVALPIAGALLAAGLWGWALVGSSSPRVSLLAPILLLLLVPADFIEPLSGRVQGFFVLGVTSLLCLSSITRDQIRKFPMADWDLFLLPTLLIIATLIHSGSGEVRGVILWASGCFFLIWLRSQEQRSIEARTQVEGAILIAGATVALLAILESGGLLHFQGLVPGYEGEHVEAVGKVGVIGFSGHHLRLGTLTMLASLLGLARIVSGPPPMRRHIVMSCTALSLIGLALSGARGSWLAFTAGAIFIVLKGNRERLWQRVTLAFACVLAIVGAAWISGAWRYFYDRAMGSASHPESLEQRLQVLQALGDAWTKVPILGLGFGGATERTMAAGLRVLNIENEYLRLLLAGGWLVVIALVIIVARRLLFAGTQRRSSGEIAARAGLVGLLVNMATYNFFAWSFGPCLFLMVAALAAPYRNVESVTASRTR